MNQITHGAPFKLNNVSKMTETHINESIMSVIENQRTITTNSLSSCVQWVGCNQGHSHWENNKNVTGIDINRFIIRCPKKEKMQEERSTNPHSMIKGEKNQNHYDRNGKVDSKSNRFHTMPY